MTRQAPTRACASACRRCTSTSACTAAGSHAPIPGPALPPPPPCPRSESPARLLRRLGAPGGSAGRGTPKGEAAPCYRPATELPRVHRLFASDRLQGGARRPKAAMPPSPLSTTHPHSPPPQAHHSVHDAGPHRAVRCVCSARGGELELRRPRADADAVSSFGRSAWRTGWECIGVYYPLGAPAPQGGGSRAVATPTWRPPCADPVAWPAAARRAVVPQHIMKVA